MAYRSDNINKKKMTKKFRIARLIFTKEIFLFIDGVWLAILDANPVKIVASKIAFPAKNIIIFK